MMILQTLIHISSHLPTHRISEPEILFLALVYCKLADSICIPLLSFIFHTMNVSFDYRHADITFIVNVSAFITYK
jgi:hypothetical protein